MMIVLVAGVMDSCSYHPVGPTPPCDTCCDTCHKPCDTCHAPCDTCPKAADTTSHNFTWTEMTIPTETTINNVCVFGPNDIWCSGSEMYHYDGMSWKKALFQVKGKSYYDGGLGCGTLFGLPDGTLWAAYAGIIVHFYPNSNTCDEYRAAVFGGGFLYSSWGTSSNNMYFVGKSGVILHFDGTNWTKMESGTTENLEEISGTSNINIWATGYSGHNHTVLTHYNGSLWKVDSISFIPTPLTGGFGSVWCGDSAGHRITIASGSIVYRKTDDGPWRNPDSGKVPNYDGGSYIGIGVRANSHNDLFAIGPWGLITHWNGASWKRYDQFFAPSASGYMTGGASVKGNTACIVGTKDGASWILLGQRQ